MRVGGLHDQCGLCIMGCVYVGDGFHLRTILQPMRLDSQLAAMSMKKERVA